MGEKVFDIILAVFVGSLIGGGAIYFLTRDAQPVHVVNGHPIEYWIRGLDSEQSAGRAEAIAALVQFGNDAIPPAIDALDRPTGQEAAINLLVTIGAPAQQALIDALNSKSTLQRGGALRAIEQMKTPPAPALLAAVARQLADETTGPQASAYLLKIGPDATCAVIAAELLEKAPTSRKNELYRVLSVARTNDPRIGPPLLRELKVGHPAYRIQALQILCTMNPPPADAVDALVESFVWFPQQPRGWGAQRALLAIGPPAVPALRRATTHPSAAVRGQAMGVLTLMHERYPETATEINAVRESDVGWKKAK